ncbi:MAG TPA: cyclodeaminase/cyclohydrolase family protein [Thermoanaerobaculia bacterium]|nr:cyclodeaminase/cyclohydrolase family protein [Thermoanaerobaculia bacterium]
MTDFSKLTLSELLEAIASEAPTPGGGTAAAVAAAMGAALAEMVAGVTLSKEKYAASHEAVRPIAGAARDARREFLALAREDSAAFDLVVAARRLPKNTEEEKAVRTKRIEEANRQATEVPMRTARAAARLLVSLPELVEKGNPNAASDAGSAALLLEAAAEAALLNVGINLSGVSDDELVGSMQRETADLQEETRRLRDQVLAEVRRRF